MAWKGYQPTQRAKLAEVEFTGAKVGSLWLAMGDGGASSGGGGGTTTPVKLSAALPAQVTSRGPALEARGKVSSFAVRF